MRDPPIPIVPDNIPTTKPMITESQKIVDVNLNGVINGIYAILPLLKKTDKSVIVNTSSIGGFVPVPGAHVAICEVNFS